MSHRSYMAWIRRRPLVGGPKDRHPRGCSQLRNSSLASPKSRAFELHLKHRNPMPPAQIAVGFNRCSTACSHSDESFEVTQFEEHHPVRSRSTTVASPVRFWRQPESSEGEVVSPVYEI